MKAFKILSIPAILVVVFVAMSFINKSKVNKIKATNTGFAVVELFTSEGCSSCPPADEVVAKIQRESKDVPVYILAYHVDYWNRLGWKDVFSSAEYSKRQNDYANYLNLQSVYTPQIVVNGKTEFVGSQESTLRSAIHNGLLQSRGTALNITYSKQNNNGQIKYAVSGDYKNTTLLIAFVQKNATTKVERGENSGQTLSHVQIVRKLQKVELEQAKGQTAVTYPMGYDAATWEIIGILQNKGNGVITGANRANQVAENNTEAKI